MSLAEIKVEGAQGQELVNAGDQEFPPVWPDWAIYYNLGNFSKPVTTIILPKLSTF